MKTLPAAIRIVLKILALCGELENIIDMHLFPYLVKFDQGPPNKPSYMCEVLEEREREREEERERGARREKERERKRERAREKDIYVKNELIKFSE